MQKGWIRSELVAKNTVLDLFLQPSKLSQEQAVVWSRGFRWTWPDVVYDGQHTWCVETIPLLNIDLSHFSIMAFSLGRYKKTGLSDCGSGIFNKHVNIIFFLHYSYVYYPFLNCVENTQHENHKRWITIINNGLLGDGWVLRIIEYFVPCQRDWIQVYLRIWVVGKYIRSKR